jgi:hypothetical protein
MIYDDSSPILFKEGDFIILTPDSVRAIIEVKANLENQNVVDVVRRANENGQFIFSDKQDKKQPFFNGIFSYEGFDKTLNFDTFQQHFMEGNLPFIDDPSYKQYKVNHVSLNMNLFLKY